MPNNHDLVAMESTMTTMYRLTPDFTPDQVRIIVAAIDGAATRN